MATAVLITATPTKSTGSVSFTYFLREILTDKDDLQTLTIGGTAKHRLGNTTVYLITIVVLARKN